MKKYLLLVFTLIISFNSFGQNDSTVSKRGKHRNAYTRPDNKTEEPCCCEEEHSVCPEMNDAVEVKTIAIDFRTKNVASKAVIRSVRKGDYVRVKIMNYNPLQYKITINATDSSVTVPIDAKMITSFFDPTSLTGIVSSLIEKSGTVPITVPDPNVMFDQNWSNLGDDGLPKKCNPSIRICPIKDCPTKNIINKKGGSVKVIDTAKCLDKFYAEVATLILVENTDIENLKKGIDKKIYEAIRKFSVKTVLYPDCTTFKAKVTAAILETLEKEIEAFAELLSSRILKMNIDLNDYAVAIASYKEYISKNNSYYTRDSLVKKFYSEALVALRKYQGVVGYENLAALVSKLEILNLYSSCYVSLPIFVADDIKKIDIEIKSRFDSLGLPNYNTTLILPPVQHKIWGVSSGIFVTGLKNDGFGVTSFTRPRTGGGIDTLYHLASDGENKAQIGANALAYTGWKVGKNDDKPNYLGLCFGAGLSIESKPKPRILLGGSLITGEKNRFMISLGFVGGYVRQLSDRFNTITDYTQLPTDFVKDVLMLNGFLSINYSFLSK